ncbi:FtsK/SpoIIIE family DNA translocase [[Clostridium] scindens]|uniref:FtsK/SpoIIIE family DNA translocase n=1 Tax=Clostridium scindens (strain JCM 10418 / VPI 12708) TaxID=29347 RepID=UPI001C700ECB|nr:DNA translocase FtsK [[Clostridium] scindens]QYX28778.1 DNA translocase FtsK [[Clostridium] scindens]
MAAKSKKRKSTKQTKKNTQQSFVRDEIIIWVTLAVSILMLISNFGIGGFVGEAISDFLFRIFGWIAFVMPFILFGAVAFVISNKGNLHAYMKVATCLILMVLVCTFLQLVDEKGGMLGNILVDVLVPAIGIAGTYVVDVILMIICLVIITGKSALKGVKAQGGKAYDKARKDAERRREQAQERRKIKEAQPKQSRSGKRSEKHVEGVSFDTTIAKKSPNVKELTIDPMEEDRMQEPDTHAVKEPGFVINRGDMPSTVSEPEAEPVMEAAPFDETPVPKKRSKMASADVASEVADVAASVAASATKPKKAYQYPPISLLKRGSKQSGESDAHLRETAMKLQQTLQNFGVNVTVTNVSCGPSVTRYELQPEMGVKVSKIVGLADDIKLNLAAADIRIEAPIPGKAAVGIEVPNKENSAVMLRDLLESKEFKNSASKISFAAGKDIGGKVVVADIAKMPHLLIAGATGSGKSVCINTLIMSILYKATPEEVKLIMIDPKVVELSVYNGIPHLMIPVVADPKKAAGALNWGVAEMTRRYQAFAEYNVRDMKGYNEKVASMPPVEGKALERMPQIVIIVDELADLMMVAPGEVEEAICRLAQLARAAGIHLVLATQRPSVNVITGLIKANMPSRIAFSVSSGVDSRTIIDMNGAEKLLGKGDMLFYPSGYQKPARVQGSFVTDKEVQGVVEYLKNHNGDVTYDEEIVNHVNTSSAAGMSGGLGAEGDDRDVHFVDAGRLIIDKDKASIGMLQRTFKIGFNRAARIMDQLFEAGVVGPEEGTKPRKVLMSPEEFERYVEETV